MGKNGFIEGVLVGAALAWAGNYFLKSEKGKETCKKVKEGFDRFRNEVETEINKFTENLNLNSEPKGDTDYTK